MNAPGKIRLASLLRSALAVLYRLSLSCRPYRKFAPPVVLATRYVLFMSSREATHKEAKCTASTKAMKQSKDGYRKYVGQK